MTLQKLNSKCTTCNNMVTYKWVPGPIPPGHPVLSDHGYFLCDKCRRTGRCPVCKERITKNLVFTAKKEFTDTDTYWGPDEKGYLFLIPYDSS